MKKLVLLALLLCSHLVFASATETRSLTVDGVARTYALHVPDGAKEPMALVIALHGGGGNGLQMERSTRFSDLADREKFVVVYPDGIGRYWNDGEREAASTTTDDIGFMRAMIADVKKLANINAARIFATGISNGGAMSSRMGCEMSDVIRGIAPVANTMKVDIAAACKPSKPVAVVEFHGTEDHIVPYNGGRIMLLGRPRGRVISTKQFSEFWAQHDGCDPTALVKELPDVAHDNTSVTKNEFQHCKAPVVFYSIAGGGHAWPSGVERKFRIVPSVQTHQVDATELIWQFFKDLH
jgi:polyhydroxybutyrate depolymerase